jgi:hypothetical protein
MHMIMFVLDDPNSLDQVLEAWYELGVTGATIMESTGLHRRRQRQRVAMRYSFDSNPLEESGNYTLFAIVANESIAEDCLRAVEQVVGDLDTANTGVFASWPLSVVKGIPPIKHT